MYVFPTTTVKDIFFFLSHSRDTTVDIMAGRLLWQLKFVNVKAIPQCWSGQRDKDRLYFDQFCGSPRREVDGRCGELGC